MVRIIFKKGKYYNIEGRNPKKALSHPYGRGLYNKQKTKTVKSDGTFNIRVSNGKYYNDNGKNPNKPLSIPYAKRLLSIQKRYGVNVSVKDASGHGTLTKKVKALKQIKDKKDVKRSVEILNKSDYQLFLDDIKNRKVDTKNLRTRFRAGFRIYHDDTPAYDVISRSVAEDGVIPLQRFLKDLPNDVFTGENVRGSFRYIIYDKNTKKVYHDMTYGEDE